LRSVTGVLVITNAAAGSGDEEAVAAAVDVLRRQTDVEVRATDTEGDVDAALADRRDRIVVAAGGDGTVHLLIARLHAGDELGQVVLGLIPLGTGNDLARGVGIPLDPAEAAAVVLSGRERAMDILVDSHDGVVVNAAHVGIGAEAAKAAGPWKRRLGKLGYAVGAVIAGVTSEGLRLVVTVDGQRFSDGSRRILQAGISNGSVIGGGTPLAPDANPGDGRADVVVSYAVGPVDRLLYGVHLKRGTHEERHDVSTRRGTEVTVSGEPFWCNCDGELRGPTASETWRVRRAAYRLMVPAPADSAVGG
jgi:YegS/Rv2252/BmrU family lipid kinase